MWSGFYPETNPTVIGLKAQKYGYTEAVHFLI